jgi:hypothetical protein
VGERVKQAHLLRSSYNDLTDTPRVEDLAGPQGPQGDPSPIGVSEWLDISNKPSWVATSHGGVNLSGFNNALSLTVNDVKWADVLNKPTLLSSSYKEVTDTPSIEDLTGPKGPQGEHGPIGVSELLDISNKPSWVATSHRGVNLSEFNNALSLTVSDVEWRTC